MTEYWVSKKQYWCKYCNIWIRDDAPSRRQHETGLKHQGQKERFIRDLYKGGVQAKAEKAQQAIEIARIESLAANAHAKDTHISTTHGRPSVLHAIQAAKAASSSRLRVSERKDKWADYSTAKQLGFDDEDTQKSSYEIEQQLKGRAANHVGAWEEVVDGPHGLYTPPPAAEDGGEGSGGQRKLGEYGVDQEENHEDFKFERKGKRPIRDVYDEDDWDPKTAFKGLKKKGDNSGSASNPEMAKADVKEDVGGLDREGWTGKLELQSEGTRSERNGLVYESGGGWVKAEEDDESHLEEQAEAEPKIEENRTEDVKPSLPDLTEEQRPTNDIPPPAEPAVENCVIAHPEDTTPAAGGLFKKRRPPPSSRKK